MESTLETLRTEIRNSDAKIRAEAVEQLCRLGPDARPVAVPLVEACDDLSESVREWATAALEEVGPPEISDVAPLATLLEHANPDVAYWAATLLGRLGTSGAEAVPCLGKALSQRGEKSVRQRIVWALGKIGSAAASELDRLEELAQGPDPRMARLATRAINHINESV